MKAKIKCVGVLSKALTPFVVLTATFRTGDAYVYLDYEDRIELASLWRSHGEEPPYAPRSLDPFPQLVRGHAIDVEEQEVTDTGTLSSHRGEWMNAEGIWVHTLVARRALEALARWRREHPARAGGIGAPNWRCLTAIRALAIAAGQLDPGINESPRSAS